MKKAKIILLAIMGLMGITTAFAGKHKMVNGRVYGILGKTAGGNDWIVELFSGHCIPAVGYQCGVLFDDEAETLTTIPVGSGVPEGMNQVYEH